MRFRDRAGCRSSQTRPNVRYPRIESLEDRRLLAAEGALVRVSTNVDAVAILGTASAQIDWGDGNVEPASLTPVNTSGPISIKLDYRYAGSFFTSTVKTRLAQAAALLANRFQDDLTAIQASGGNTWTAVFPKPNAPNLNNLFAAGSVARVTNLTVPANQVVVFPGATNLPGYQLGVGAYGGFDQTSLALADTVRYRGEAGARSSTDFAPWGGSVTFDTVLPNNASWYFGTDAEGLGSNQYDFVTVAVHELAHVLGFGTAPSWKRFVSGNKFTGPASRAAYEGSGNPPLSGTQHWDRNDANIGFNTLNSIIPIGTRMLPTKLDFAGLDDLGWQLDNRRTTVTSSHVYADDGQYEAEIIVRGSQYGEVRLPLSQTITNVTPTLTPIATQTVIAGAPFQITDIGSITDPGIQDNFEYTINWGDGSTVDTGFATIDQRGSATQLRAASFDGSHTYETAGSRTVRLTVDDGSSATTRQFSVVVVPPPRLELSLNKPAVKENEGPGSVRLTVRRIGGIVGQPVTVNLRSSDASEVRLPSSITLPGGQTSQQVLLDIIDDELLDGSQTVEIIASGVGLEPVDVAIDVDDHEIITGVFDAARVLEGETAQLTVSRSNKDQLSPLEVVIGGSHQRLNVPETIVIPRNRVSVTIDISTVDDEQQQRPVEYPFVFSAAPYISGTAEITLRDDEPAFHQNTVAAVDVDGDGESKPIDALRIINRLTGGAVELDVEPQAPSSFPDVNGDYVISPVDALVVINHLASSAFGEQAEPEYIVPLLPSYVDHALQELDDEQYLLDRLDFDQI